MPHFVNCETDLYYEESGEGFPILLIAPGGMKSVIPAWANAPWNPVEVLQSEFRVIAMEQRNAGRSSAPISASDGWHVYTRDQLSLMDHLGIDRFHVMGMCIGGPYCMGLIQSAPERVASSVIFQSIGLDDNRDAFYAMFDNWAEELKPRRNEVDESDWQGFRENMYGGDFLFNVSREFVQDVQTPLLLLRGNDLYHPQSVSRELAELAPNAQLIEDWKEGDCMSTARDQVLGFLRDNADHVQQ